jgi:hypothetical protein
MLAGAELIYSSGSMQPSHRHNNKRVVDLSLLRLIDVFHADLPSIGVTIADPCLVTLPLRSLTIFRDDADVIADLIDLNNLIGIHRASMTTCCIAFLNGLLTHTDIRPPGSDRIAFSVYSAAIADGSCLLNALPNFINNASIC